MRSMRCPWTTSTRSSPGPGSVLVLGSLPSSSICAPGARGSSSTPMPSTCTATRPTRSPTILARTGSALVLTPHARELDRIGGDGTYLARAARVPELARRLDAHVVAKGPGTLSAAPDGTVHVSPFDVAALATAGTGDVLAGMLGATLAAGWAQRVNGAADDVARAVARTVWWHAAAGRLAGSRSAGHVDALAVLAALPQVLAQLAALRPMRDPGPSGRVSIAALLDVTRDVDTRGIA
jgi:hypothetical protein